MRTQILQLLLPTLSTLDWTSPQLFLSSGSSSSSTSLLFSSLNFSQPGTSENPTSFRIFYTQCKTPTSLSLTGIGMLMMEQLRNTEKDSEKLWQRSTVWFWSTSSSTLFCWGQWSTQVKVLWNCFDTFRALGFGPVALPHVRFVPDNIDGPGLDPWTVKQSTPDSVTLPLLCESSDKS